MLHKGFVQLVLILIRLIFRNKNMQKFFFTKCLLLWFVEQLNAP